MKEATIGPIAFVLAMSLSCGTAVASDAENIKACIDAIKTNTARSVDEFDVAYQGSFFAFSVAEWPGIHCEVTLGQVYSLAVDGREIIVEGWPSPEAKETYEQLANEVEAAVNQLKTRQKLLEQRLDEAEKQLMQPGANVKAVTVYVRDGISKAVGR